MEELADAIEDAQYVNAISTQDDGPKPVLAWDKPTEEQLAEWERAVIKRQTKINAQMDERIKKEKELVEKNRASSADPTTLSAALKLDPTGSGGLLMKCDAFTLNWVCQQPIGYFLFSQFVKQKGRDYVRMNFCEEIWRFRRTRGRRNRLEKAVVIAKAFLVKPTGSTAEEPLKDKATADETNNKDVEESQAPILPNIVGAPRPTEIVEYDLCRGWTMCSELTQQEIKEMHAKNCDYPSCSQTFVGIMGLIREEIFDRIAEIERLFPDATQVIESRVRENSVKQESYSSQELKNREDGKKKKRSKSMDLSPFEDSSYEVHPDELQTSNRASTASDNGAVNNVELQSSLSPEKFLVRELSGTGLNSRKGGPLTNSGAKDMLNTVSSKLRSKRFTGHNLNILVPIDMFDKAETVVMESLKIDYWDSFQQSENYSKLKNFLWYRDRKVVPDDFLTMRVLGRGGFGLVYACKKGTSGKLYAMKVMSKRRIKMKKSEVLCLNERKALEAVNSKFVVNLNYSFHSKEDVYLILDLMTGGDLGFHLHQRGRFSKAECIYFAARIMLGLQALHDEKYVYRDLKPENCLLGEDGRVKITDLGLATKITPDLHGAAGTRGYWAPEMLRRDSNGKRLTYGHTVDWFSFGCCVAEFISGTNPFRSEAALNFGLEHGKQTKEKAIDHATCEMNPEFPSEKYEPDAADLCRRLLDKNEKTRLGSTDCQEIMAHPWFKSVNWDRIISDRESPPFIPLRDINAASREEISTFPEDKAYQETVITEKDEQLYKNWEWTNPNAFAAEVIEFLIYERETGEPLLPIAQQGTCCCAIL